MSINLWTRKGWFYESVLIYYRGDQKWTCTKRLGFISYHFIKYYHGPAMLNHMATTSKWLVGKETGLK